MREDGFSIKTAEIPKEAQRFIQLFKNWFVYFGTSLSDGASVHDSWEIGYFRLNWIDKKEKRASVTAGFSNMLEIIAQVKFNDDYPYVEPTGKIKFILGINKDLILDWAKGFQRVVGPVEWSVITKGEYHYIKFSMDAANIERIKYSEAYFIQKRHAPAWDSQDHPMTELGVRRLICA